MTIISVHINDLILIFLKKKPDYAFYLLHFRRQYQFASVIHCSLFFQVSKVSLIILNMNFEPQHMRLNFSKMLHDLLKDSFENEIIRNNYLGKLAIIKDSLKIPKELPSSEEISKFFTLLTDSHKSSKKVALKSFFIKTKVFLVWLISVYELFSQRSLEEFVILVINILY